MDCYFSHKGPLLWYWWPLLWRSRLSNVTPHNDGGTKALWSRPLFESWWIRVEDRRSNTCNFSRFNEKFLSKQAKDITMSTWRKKRSSINEFSLILLYLLVSNNSNVVLDNILVQRVQLIQTFSRNVFKGLQEMTRPRTISGELYRESVQYCACGM